MSAAKILITGLPNSGKTSLIKGLEGSLTFARDGKPFPFEQWHINLPDFTNISELEDIMTEKINAYNDKIGEYPKTIVVDSVSRIFSEIVTNCQSMYSGFDIWNNVDKQISTFVEFLNSLLEADMNVIYIAHAVWDEKAGTYIETCKGSFAKVGGFLSTVDYAIQIENKSGKRVVHHRNKSLARSLIAEMPDKQPVEEFDMSEYINKINETAKAVTEQWSI